jgi:hypothetical protein
MKYIIISLILILAGCAEKKEKLTETRAEGTKPPAPSLFTGNPTNYEVVEANGLFAIAKGGWVSESGFGTCEEASKFAAKMNRVENISRDDFAAELKAVERRRALPWKAVDCGQEPVASPENQVSAPDTNVMTFEYTNVASGLVFSYSKDTNSPIFRFQSIGSVSPILFETWNMDELVVRITTNASVEFGKGIKPDEAALQFWNMVAKAARNQ